MPQTRRDPGQPARYKARERGHYVPYSRSDKTFLGGGCDGRPAAIDEDRRAIQTFAKIAPVQVAQRGHHGHQPPQEWWNMVPGDAVAPLSDALRFAAAKNRQIRRILQSQPGNAALSNQQRLLHLRKCDPGRTRRNRPWCRK